MNKTDYIQLLENPKTLDSTQIGALTSILEQFPYVQSARAMQLKALKQQDSFEYNQALKKSAAYTTDRSILFDFITSETFAQPENEYAKAFIEEIEVVDAQVVKKLHEQVDERMAESTVLLASEKPETPPIETKTPTQMQEAEAVLEVGKPLQFDTSERHSFNEWLQLSTLKPIVREEKTEEKSTKSALIDSFIANNPKISKVKKEGISEEKIPQKTTIDNALMTETLAKVYVEQKKYKNAIQAYTILSLKYPEKSGFFADRIKAVQELQNK